MNANLKVSGRLLVFWSVCAVLASVAFWTSVRIGAIRVSPSITVPGVLRLQVLPWLVTVVLTPLATAWCLRFAVGRTSPAGLLAAHAAGVAVFGLCDVLLVTNLNLLFLTRPEPLTWTTYLGRLTSSAVLIVAKYSIIFGATTAYLLHERAAERAREADRLARARLVLERELAEARLSVLRNQLQPHFLFNALNAASGLIEEDPPGARRVLARIGELLRAVLTRSSTPAVTLGEELEFTDRYLEIEHARLGPRLTVRFDVPADLLGARVPAFAIQPLAENAVRHGIAPRPSGGTLDITARRIGRHMELRVSNDADRPAALSEGVGLGTLRAQLAAMYGADASLATTYDEAGRFATVVTLPV